MLVPDSFFAGLSSPPCGAITAGAGAQIFVEWALGSDALTAIIMMDNTGAIAYWNKAAQRIFGYSAQERDGNQRGTP